MQFFNEINKIRKENDIAQMTWWEGAYAYACKRSEEWGRDYTSGLDGHYNFRIKYALETLAETRHTGSHTMPVYVLQDVTGQIHLHILEL